MQKEIRTDFDPNSVGLGYGDNAKDLFIRFNQRALKGKGEKFDSNALQSNSFIFVVDETKNLVGAIAGVETGMQFEKSLWIEQLTLSGSNAPNAEANAYALIDFAKSNYTRVSIYLHPQDDRLQLFVKNGFKTQMEESHEYVWFDNEESGNGLRVDNTDSSNRAAEELFAKLQSGEIDEATFWKQVNRTKNSTTIYRGRFLERLTELFNKKNRS